MPGIKGATASAQVKPATLETGLVVQVPPFVNEGDKVRVNTETGRIPVASLRWLDANVARSISSRQCHDVRQLSGWIEVITGSMFSGKSEELIRRLRRAQIARQKVQIFKPLIDDRFSEDHIVSHSDMRIAVAERRRLRRAARARSTTTPKSSGIDEGQFFDANLPAACNTLADRGKRVIVAGLDQDYLGRPFEPMPQLLAIAEYITKTLAICVVCGDPANHTQRLVASSDRVLVGATGLYEARCRHCFDPAPRRAVEEGCSWDSWQSDRSSRSQPIRDRRGLDRHPVLLGAGFLVANAQLLLEYVQFLRRRRGALLTWRAPEAAATTAWRSAIGVVARAAGRSPSSSSSAGRRSARSMMFVYYAYLSRSAGASAAGSTRTASGPTRRSSRTTRSAASAGGKASTR